MYYVVEIVDPDLIVLTNNNVCYCKLHSTASREASLLKSIIFIYIFL